MDNAQQRRETRRQRRATRDHVTETSDNAVQRPDDVANTSDTPAKRRDNAVETMENTRVTSKPCNSTRGVINHVEDITCVMSEALRPAITQYQFQDGTYADY